MVALLRKLAECDEGQDLAEYGIALAVVAGFVVAVTLAIANDVQTLWSNAQSAVDTVANP